MKNIRKQIVSWKNDFEAAKFANVLNEYKSCLAEQQWSLDEEVYAASYCLIALNVEVHKNSKPNVDDAPEALVIFELAKGFCESAAKSWELVTVDFPAGVFYIFKFLLDRDHVAESLHIATRAFEYQTKRPASENTKNQPNVLYSMLIHLFNFTEKLPLTQENRSKVSDLLTFLSTNFTVGSRAKLPAFLKYFSSFFLKSSRTNGDYVDECCSVLKNLARSVCHEVAEAESTFMEIIRTLVSAICELSLNKQSQTILLHYIDTFEEFCSTSPICVSFCRNIFRIAVCLPDEKCLSDVVVRANYELQMLIAEKSPVLKSAVYFSTVVILKMRNWDSVECPFKKNCALQLFELLYTLAEQLYEINLNEFCQIVETPRKDIYSCVYLCSFLLHFAEKITDLNLGVPSTCDYIFKSFEFFRKCIGNVRSLEQKKRHHMLSFIGGSCVNIYHKLAEFQLQRKYVELCTIIVPAFATLDGEDLTIPDVQACLKKIIVNLCVSYRTTNSFVESLIASVVWSIILPNHSSTFMDIFGILKQKLYASKNEAEQSLHLLTSADLLKHEKNTWQHDSLNQVNAIDLLRRELEQYKKFNIRSVKLMQNMIEGVRKLKPTVYQKSLLYTMIGEILTNSDSTENVEFLKKFVKSVDVLVNCLSKYADSPLETEVTTLHALLGDLLYVKFRIELLIHRSENEGELKSLSSFKKPATAEPGMEPDFKEEGNITLTNYVCLSAQRKLTRVLDSAVENWQKGLHNKSKLDLSHLKDAALIYRLYCSIAKEIEMWELLYSAAILTEDFTMAVYAYANLLTKPWAPEPEWKNNVENDLLPKASDDIRLFYQLNYLHRRLVDGFDKQDEKMLLSLPQDVLVKHNLFANYCFLVSLCQQRNVVKFSKNQQLMSFLAYSNLMCRMKSRKWNSLGECCELQSLLFDVVLLFVTSNVQVYQVTEAKSYLKDPINLILKLSLPFRICQYLNISVRIDALTCALDECYLKLQDICDILELKRDKQALLCKPAVLAPVLSPVMDSDFRADGGGRRVALPSLSHVAPQWKFQLPDFMSHERKCDCDLCTSHEYSRLLCEVTALFGVYYRLADRGTDAVEFFEGAIRMHDIIEERYSPVCRSLIVELLKIKSFVLFEYANYRLMTGDFDAASTLNALSLQHSRNNDFPIQHCCVEQRWAIRKALVAEKEKETKREARKTIARPERARASRAAALLKSAALLKTPAARRPVSATPSRLPQPLVFVDDDGRPAGMATAPPDITPYPRQSRRALFGDFASPVKPPPKGRRERKPQTNTPPDFVLQTPSALEKRSRRLAERGNASVARKLPLRAANAAPTVAAPSPSKATARRKPLSRREKENAPAKK